MYLTIMHLITIKLLEIIHLVRTQIFRKTNISYPLICKRTFTYKGQNVSFFGKFCVRITWMTPNSFRILLQTH